MDFINDMFAFVREGFNDVRAMGTALFIAFVVAFFLMTKWGQLLIMTVGATIVHLLAVAFVKPLLDGGKIAMPPLMDGEYWKVAAGLAVGYLILIIVLFFLKNNVFKIGKGGGH